MLDGAFWKASKFDRIVIDDLLIVRHLDRFHDCIMGGSSFVWCRDSCECSVLCRRTRVPTQIVQSKMSLHSELRLTPHPFPGCLQSHSVFPFSKQHSAQPSNATSQKNTSTSSKCQKNSQETKKFRSRQSINLSLKVKSCRSWKNCSGRKVKVQRRLLICATRVALLVYRYVIVI